AKAHAQVERRGARGDELSLHALVEGDVGPAETVDRLLGVADEEELPRRRPGAPPVVRARIVGGEEEQYLRLQRIRGLELVDEEMREAALELRPHGRVAAHQVARAEQEIQEVEAAGAALERLVALHDRPELVAQARGEVGTRAAEEVVERGAELRSAFEQL